MVEQDPSQRMDIETDIEADIGPRSEAGLPDIEADIEADLEAELKRRK
jgi:hypothetical protein